MAGPGPLQGLGRGAPVLDSASDTGEAQAYVDVLRLCAAQPPQVQERLRVVSDLLRTVGELGPAGHLEQRMLARDLELRRGFGEALQADQRGAQLIVGLCDVDPVSPLGQGSLEGE